MYNFKRKSKAESLGDVWRKDLPDLGIFCVFPPNFMPIAQYLDDCLFGHWMDATGNRSICQISAFPWHCRRGRQAVSGAFSHSKSLWAGVPKTQLETAKKGKGEVLVGTGRTESIQDTPGRVRAHWALQSELFYKQVTLVNTDWVWPSCKDLWSIQQWDHGPSHEASLTPEVAYPMQKHCESWVGRKTLPVTVRYWKDWFGKKEILLSEQGGH